MSGTFREKMPGSAAAYDAFALVFGRVTLTYAEENGIVRGTPSKGGYIPETPVKAVKK